MVDGDGSVRGIESAHAIAVTPDGRHVYAGGNDFGRGVGLAIFARNSVDNSLAFVAPVSAPFSGESWSAAVSPDGKHVYLGAEHLRAFRRDASTGELSFIAFYDLMNPSSSYYPTAIAISGDGLYVYVATCWDVQAVRVFRRDPSTGELAFISGASDEQGPFPYVRDAAAALSPDGQHLYVACDRPDSGVTVFRRDGVTGTLSVVGPVSESNSGARGVAVSPDGRHVYITDRLGNEVKVFGRDQATGILTLAGAEGGLPDGSPRAVAVSPDGGSVVVTTDETGSAVTAFRRNLNTGELTFAGTHKYATPGLGEDGIEQLGLPISVVVAPDSGGVYVAALVSKAVVAFRRDADTGGLIFVNALAEGDGGLRLGRATSLAASPDASFVYVLNEDSFSHDITLFGRDLVTGRLTHAAIVNRGERGEQGGAIAISSDGTHMYVTSPSKSSVKVFRRNSGSGSITFVAAAVDGKNGVEGLQGAKSISVSPDGRNVYVTGSKLVVFRRDATSGTLQFLQALPTEGVGGRKLPGSATVSSDGRFAYLSGYFDNWFAVFAREPSDGTLEFLHLVKYGDAPGVPLESGPNPLALSPDGQHLYMLVGRVVVIFARDAATGGVEYISTVPVRLIPDIQSDDQADVAVSPDGRRLFATGWYEQMVSFVRDPSGGLLAYEHTFKQNLAGVRGMYGPADVEVSPDGGNVYVAAEYSHAVAGFRIRAEIGSPCLDNEGCETTSCVKGLCCTVPCDGPGESCELADHRGVCVTRCVGDCSGDRVCTVDELIVAVNIALGLSPRGTCEIADANGDGRVHVSELIAAVNSALAGCDIEVSGSWQQDNALLVSSTCRPEFTDTIRREIAGGAFDCQYELEQNGTKVTAPDYTGTIGADWRLTLNRTQRFAGGNCSITIIDAVTLEPAVSQTTATRTTAYRYSDGCGYRDCRVTIDARWTRLPPG